MPQQTIPTGWDWPANFYVRGDPINLLDAGHVQKDRSIDLHDASHVQPHQIHGILKDYVLFLKAQKQYAYTKGYYTQVLNDKIIL